MYTHNYAYLNFGYIYSGVGLHVYTRFIPFAPFALDGRFVFHVSPFALNIHLKSKMLRQYIQYPLHFQF